LYKNIFQTPQEAIDYFNKKRAEGPSLTLPSQIRAVYNYYKLLQVGRPSGVGPIADLTLVNNPKKFLLKSIILTPVPRTGFKATGCKPAIELYDRAGFTLPQGARPVWSYTSNRKYKPPEVAIGITVDVPICGEVLLKFYHVSMDSIKSGGHLSLLFRIHFHTSFVETTYIDFPLPSLDAPESDLSMRMSPTKILDERFRVRLLLVDIEGGEVKVDVERKVGKVIEEVYGTKEKVTEERVNEEKRVTDEERVNDEKRVTNEERLNVEKGAKEEVLEKDNFVN